MSSVGSGEFVTRLPVQWESATHQPGRLQHRGGRFFVEVCSGAVVCPFLEQSQCGRYLAEGFRTPGRWLRRSGDHVRLDRTRRSCRHYQTGRALFPGRWTWGQIVRRHPWADRGAGRVPLRGMGTDRRALGRHTNRYFVSLSSGDRHPVTAAHAARQLATDQWVRPDSRPSPLALQSCRHRQRWPVGGRYEEQSGLDDGIAQGRTAVPAARGFHHADSRRR